LENAGLQERVVSVAEYLHEKRDLYFDWHQVAKKSWTAGQGFGRNYGPDQQTKPVFVVALSTASRS
jgi:hypothetical protein